LRTPKEHGSIKAVLITEMAECLNRLPYQMRGFVLGLAWFGMVLFFPGGVAGLVAECLLQVVGDDKQTR
jgi:hypothetical protein